jgi:fumarate reductase subunit D
MTEGKNIEPLWWALFSAGGVVAAFLVPIHIIIFGFALPFGWISDSGMLYRNWLVKIYLFVLIALPLYHWAHRFYFAVNDMKLGLPQKPLSVLCYGGAIVGTIATFWVLLLL